VIAVTIYAIYIVVYRFILYRLPILYKWKEEPAFEAVAVPSRSGMTAAYKEAVSPAASYTVTVAESYPATGLGPDESGRRGL
jgi:hypothetical protein